MNDIVNIDPNKIVIHGLNRVPPPEHVKELAVSIKQDGQITPALIRPHPDKPGFYEVGAGACRAQACMLLGIDVRAVVKAMDDLKFERILIVENLLRKDLDPFEEADNLRELIERGHSLAEFAASAGKTTQWLLSRIRLTNLDPKVGKDIKGKWPLELIETLADFPQEVQEALYASFRYRTPGIKEIREYGLNHAVDIESDEWLKDERTANGSCGKDGCLTSSADMLFKTEGKCLQCVNASCHRIRLAKHAAITLAEAFEAFGARTFVRKDVFQLIEQKLGNVQKGPKTIGMELVKSDLGKKASKITDETCYLIGFDKQGKLETWPFSPKKVEMKDDGTPVKAPTSPMEASQEAKPDKAAALHAKRFSAMLESLIEAVKGYVFTGDLLPLIAAFGTNWKFERETFNAGDRWKMMKDGKYNSIANYGKDSTYTGINAKAMVTEMVREQILERLKWKGTLSGAYENTNLLKEFHNAATFIGFDLKEANLRVAKDHPPAKSWAGEVDPITLKPKKK
jgi:ParB/RepB/Spo0J family partition protein